jgi:hypothetical protein
MLLPHLLHGLVLGLVTSSYFSRFGKTWRTQATLAALALFAVELWVTGISPAGFQQNATARSEAEVVWTHWRMQLVRGVGMAGIDAVLGATMWLSATRRWNIGWGAFVTEERLKESSMRMERAGTFLQAGRHLKQAVLRDEELRGKYVEWWAKETTVGRELLEDEEVKTVRNDSLPSRMNFDRSRMEAEKASQEMMGMMTAGMQRQAANARPHQE